MKNIFKITAAFVLTLTLLTGCSKPQPDPTVATKPHAATTVPATQATAEVLVAETQSAVPYDIDGVYARQIERYYTAISQQWDENAY